MWWTRYSLPSFWAKLGYSQIKIDRKLISLYSLQSKIGVHLLNGELTQHLNPIKRHYNHVKFQIFPIRKISIWNLSSDWGNYDSSRLCEDMKNNFYSYALDCVQCEILIQFFKFNYIFFSLSFNIFKYFVGWRYPFKVHRIDINPKLNAPELFKISEGRSQLHQILG